MSDKSWFQYGIPHDAGNYLLVPDVRVNKTDVFPFGREIPGATPAQIVENCDRSVAFTDQSPDQMTANKARAARHQNSRPDVAAIDPVPMVQLSPSPAPPSYEQDDSCAVLLLPERSIVVRQSVWTNWACKRVTCRLQKHYNNVISCQ